MMSLRKWQKGIMMTAMNVHFPTWADEPLDNKDLKRWAEEYNMSVEDFKKYMNFFYSLAE